MTSPGEVVFCKRCVVSNQRPNSAENEYALVAESKKSAIHIGEDGVCDACKLWEAKHETIDWDQREKQLRELCAEHRRDDGRYEFPEASLMFEQPIMDREYFDHLCDRFRSPPPWRFENGRFTLRPRVEPV